MKEKSQRNSHIRRFATNGVMHIDDAYLQCTQCTI